MMTEPEADRKQNPEPHYPQPEHRKRPLKRDTFPPVSPEPMRKQTGNPVTGRKPTESHRTPPPSRLGGGAGGGYLAGLQAQLPRLALTRSEAAAAIGMSVDSFERYVQPELKIVRMGRMRLVPVRELERWLDRSAAKTLD